MLMRDFINVVSPSASLEIRSGRTDDHIKTCRVSELTEEDVLLHITFIHPTIYFDFEKKLYFGRFLLCVSEE